MLCVGLSTSSGQINFLTQMHTNLHKSMEDLEDLFLNEDREDGSISQKLGDELLNPRQKDLHSCQQWLPLICLSVPAEQRHARTHSHSQ